MGLGSIIDVKALDEEAEQNESDTSDAIDYDSPSNNPID
jgi:hypothetical protein